MGFLNWLLGRKPISFEGGSGDTIESAIVIHGARNAMRGVSEEYRYLERRFGKPGVDWRLVEQGLIEGEDGKHFDLFTLSLQDDEDGRSVLRHQ